MDKKSRYIYILITRDSPQNKKFTQAKSEDMEKIFHSSGYDKQAVVALLTSDEIDCKTKAIIKEKNVTT